MATTNPTIATTVAPFSSSCPSRRGRGRSCLLEVVCLLPTLESRNVTTDLVFTCIVVLGTLHREFVMEVTARNIIINIIDHGLFDYNIDIGLFVMGQFGAYDKTKIAKALAEQHQVAPCDEKQLKEKQQQQRRHASQKVTRKAAATTANHCILERMRIPNLAAIQSVYNDCCDSNNYNDINRSFHVLDLTASRG
jgi:hypothetical protein